MKPAGFDKKRLARQHNFGIGKTYKGDCYTDYDMLKKAVNLRYERRKAARSIRHPSGKGYGTPVSWEKGKCPHQWKEKR